MAALVSIPSVDYVEFELKPVRMVDTVRMEGRVTESQESGFAYWRLKQAQTPNLKVSEIAQFEAFHMQVNAAGGCFLAYDHLRPRPLSAGATPLADGAGGKAVLDTITNSKQVNISGMPADFVLGVGDYVGFSESSLVRSLHLLTQAVTVNGSGLATLNFDYALDLQNFTTAAEVVFEKPSCVMQMNNDFSLPKAWGSRRASFSATEVFLG